MLTTRTSVVILYRYPTQSASSRVLCIAHRFTRYARFSRFHPCRYAAINGSQAAAVCRDAGFNDYYTLVWPLLFEYVSISNHIIVTHKNQ